MNPIKAAASEIKIESNVIGLNRPTYFIADIAANHDGDIERAKDLIWKAKDAGANAAKFQHFEASSIVSDAGFRALGTQLSHQSNWKKSVFDVYKDASVKSSWSSILRETCCQAGITFFTSPYSFSIVDEIDPYVPAYKIGSGDITWHQIIKYIASKNKPYILATGASTMDEVVKSVELSLPINNQLALLQCNTNYTGSFENFQYIQLNVLKSYAAMFPSMILGLSDHTPGHSCVLGAVALGARIIEKHFTDDTSRVGPDHKFSMSPASWREMVDRTRELEAALGNGIKRVEKNEEQTVIVQRRSIRVVGDLPQGHILTLSDVIPLRPCPTDALPPTCIDEVIGKTLAVPKLKGDYLRISDINSTL